MAQKDTENSTVLDWEEELSQAIIGMNEHTAHAIDIINEQLEKMKEQDD